MKTNGIGWCSYKKKSESSPWDLYSMYVVLQGIGSLPCIMDQFPLGSSNPDVRSSWTGTLKKHQVTRNDKFIFVLWKKMSFSSSPKVTPTTGAVEQWEKLTLQWKPMELGGVPIKKKWIFPLRLIFYVCSSARNWVSSMYKGIDQFPLGSSDPGCLKFLNWRTFQEKKVPWNDQLLFILH